MAAISRLSPRFVIASVLVGVTLSVFWQTGDFPFVGLDDQLYVYQNRHVLQGLTPDGVSWAFTTGHAGNWHPLAWLSHMLDVALFGADAGSHHRTNLLFHLLNVMLLFLLLNDMTGRVWRSGFVAALFAVHPLHVESVAWVAERKDLLCALFWILTVWAYVRYTRNRRPLGYALVVFSYGLGLLSKPMLVTLPFVLLLFDYWPLGRITSADAAAGSDGRRVAFKGLLWEKVPLFAMSAASCTAAYLAQKSGGTVNAFPVGLRIANAFVAYAAYLLKTVWPASLAVYYPHPWFLPDGLPVWKVTGAVILLASLSLLCFANRRRCPFLAVGWLLYLGVLVPVIGFLQVGGQAMADRYTYIPLTGIFIMIAWGVPKLLGNIRFCRYVLAFSGGAALIGLAVAAWFQTAHWRGSGPLFEHALKVTSRNWLAHYCLGAELASSGRLDEAIGHFETALQIRPDYAEACEGLGLALYGKGMDGQGEAYLRTAMQLNPLIGADIYNNVGAILARRGRLDAAAAALRKGVALEPGNALGRYNLATVLLDQGKVEESVAEFREALRYDPEFADAHANLGGALLHLGRLDEAIFHLREALRRNPADSFASRDLAAAEKARGIRAHTLR